MLPGVWNLQRCRFVDCLNNICKCDKLGCDDFNKLRKTDPKQLLSTVQISQNSSNCTRQHKHWNVSAPAKVDWISESHALYVYETMLKGSLHNGPWWGWDDGYGLSLRVNAAGPGPPQVYSVTSFAICQHWVGTNPWPGLGQRTPGPPRTTHTSL